MTDQLGRLDGKVAIVTGAGSPLVDGVVGIGRAIATRFAREGAQVVLADLDTARGAETLEAIRAEGGTATLVEGDVSVADDCAGIASTARQEFGRIDVLVNNVGIADGFGRLEAFDEKVWQRVIDTNLKSVALMASATIPHMIEAGGGALVNIASVAALGASGAGVAYGPSKAALVAMSREIALLHGRDGIRSNAIAPGHLYTPMVIGMLTDDERSTRRRISPLDLEGTAEDVANAALFLAGDEARYITGVCLPVDGGVSELLGLAAVSLLDES